ncbi:hypothetical protein JCM10212_001493 [Sporobolomyces blumeae]
MAHSYGQHDQCYPGLALACPDVEASEVYQTPSPRSTSSDPSVFYSTESLSTGFRHVCDPRCHGEPPSSTPYTSGLATPAPEDVKPSVPTRAKSSATSRKTGQPPRPPNAWICYRSARVHELRATPEYLKIPQADISKIIGQLWRSESPEVRKRYELEAAAKKLEHRKKYPDYTFKPTRKGSGSKAAAKKARTSKKTTPSPSPAASPSGIPSVLLQHTASTSAFRIPTPSPPRASSRASLASYPEPLASSPVSLDHPSHFDQSYLTSNAFTPATSYSDSYMPTFDDTYTQAPLQPAPVETGGLTMFRYRPTTSSSFQAAGLPAPPADFSDHLPPSPVEQSQPYYAPPEPAPYPDTDHHHPFQHFAPPEISPHEPETQAYLDAPWVYSTTSTTYDAREQFEQQTPSASSWEMYRL